MLKNIKSCRALISGILAQAFSDAISGSRANDSLGAKRFIDDKNPIFIYYCELLDMNPEYVAKKMQQRIRDFTFKPLKRLRE